MSDDNPFWDYSLRLYPHIETWCLQQQARGCNVNLLLLCCFVGSRGVVLSDDQLTHAKTCIEPWDTKVVVPLRTLRQALKARPLNGDSEAVRQAIAKAELLAEQQVQKQLYDWWRKESGTINATPEQAISDNLMLAGAEQITDFIVQQSTQSQS
ncbi:TIGR02444 family protein [Porticoccaceae bacterium LTM1]|nr:TIGR02444 family protein [Porticoccaceae bacterium LTM1]